MSVQASSNYHAHAQSVDPTEITSSDPNAEVLRRLRDNHPELRALCIVQSNPKNRLDYFVLQEGDDLERLGCLIGSNTVLIGLYIEDLPGYRVQITALVKGIGQNKSIRELGIEGDLGEAVLTALSATLRSKSCSLITASVHNIPLGEGVALDASSVSNAHRSNHTLRVIWYRSLPRSNYPQDDVEQQLSASSVACFDYYKFVRSMPGEAIDGYRHSSHKKRIGHYFILMCTLVLICLLGAFLLLRSRSV
jgi:hypothetical protein